MPDEVVLILGFAFLAMVVLLIVGFTKREVLRGLARGRGNGDSSTPWLINGDGASVSHGSNHGHPHNGGATTQTGHHGADVGHHGGFNGGAGHGGHAH